MAKPVEPLAAGAVVLAKGEDLLLRGDRNIFFHFDHADMSALTMEESINTVFAGIPATEPLTGSFNQAAINGVTLRYRVEPSRNGEYFAVSYTLLRD